MRSEMSKECKVCTRPFTVFRWKAGTAGRFKKTEICNTCSRLKNCCQTCLLDLTYGLPIAARDALMPEGAVAPPPKSGANVEFYNNINAKKVEDGLTPFDRAQIDPLVNKMARTGPYYDRNRAQLCSFFAKGTCNRGVICPYRHELPEIKEGQEDLATQKLKDRYYGVNDPVAKRILKRAATSAVAPPADRDIKTLYIANVDPRIGESDLKDHFYHFGEIAKIKMMIPQKCAFIEFTTRAAAEQAVTKNNKLIVKGCYLRTAWAKPTKKKIVRVGGAPVSQAVPINSGIRPSYPSMDPNRLGARPEPAAPAPASGAPAAALGTPNWSAAASDGDGPPTKKARVAT
eukprot:TRINITY_DN10903_c0_g1_i1.p1 TRINITY_DN10903_c0_g1~~TRINITY_DN10903_c0_g1_i1.p1  ORF type:complete len:379 (+),score=88.98 TRINITY_DN10903_c0_g1_i1:104-1138(+)